MDREVAGLDPLRANAEAKLARATPMPTPPSNANELMHELQVHQIELEMQNEALRQSQIALEESRDRYVDLYEFAPVGYLTLDRAGLIEQLNLTGATLLGIERKELRRNRFARFVGPEDRDRWERLFLGVMAWGGDGRSLDLELRRGDGSRFQARINCLRVAEAGAPPTVRVALTDISGLKQAEERAEAATRSLQRQGGILDAVMKGAKAAQLAYLDRDFVFIRVSESYAENRGYRPEQLVGKNHFALSPDPGMTAAFVRARDTGMPAEGHDQPVVFPDQPERGTTYWDWTLIPVTNESGEVQGLMYILIETTGRGRREAERIRSLEAQRDTLVREVHHRIKNHLQGVVGLLRARMAEQCETSAALEGAIGQIGAIARAYGLQGEGSKARTTVEQLVRAAAENISGPITIEVGSAPDARPHLLAGNETVAMALVINELLTNASKHGSSADRPVRVYLEAGPDYSRIRVENGPAWLPAGFDWSAGLGLGTGLELLRSLMSGQGTRLDYRQEDDRVIADLTLTAPVIDR